MKSNSYPARLREWSGTSPKGLRRFLIGALICLSTAVPAPADDEAADLSDTESKPAQLDNDISQLPDKLPDGRAIRTIGLYEDQMDALIPDHFHPISISSLLTGITKLAPTAVNDSQSRVNTAVYWIDLRDDLMISRRSEIGIESDAETLDSDSEDGAIVQHSLGQVNLAIEPSRIQNAADDLNLLPRLENNPDGDLIAVFETGTQSLSKVQFKWQRRGQAAGAGYSFDLKIPRSPQTRIVLSVPTGTKLEALDGVLRARSGPPPDADTAVTGNQKRWFELDAGGLNRVRIRTFPTDATAMANPWILRSTSLQYLAEASGLQWVCRMQVQPPEVGRFPVLRLRNTTVSNISVNSFDVRFTSAVRGSIRDIQIEVPDSILRNENGLATVIVSGTSSYRSNTSWLVLPMPFWRGNVQIAATVDQVQLVIPDGLQVARWELPSNWNLQNRQTIDEGSTMYLASGPSPFQRLTSSTDGPLVRDQTGLVWSRLRLIRKPSIKSAETALQLESINGSLNARARIAVNTDLDGLTPFHIRVEPDWKIDSLTFVNSGRVIEQPRVGALNRVLALWPESEDINEGAIAIEVSGSRPLDREQDRLTIPASWFVTPQNVNADLTAAVIRPSNFNWSSVASVLPETIGNSQIPDSMKDFFGNLPRDALLFRPRFGRTPIVSLETPLASFDATTRLIVLRDRNELIEQLEIGIENSGQPLEQVMVHTGPSRNRPDYQWSLTDIETPNRIPLPNSAIELGSGNQDGIYTIDLSDQSLRSYRLIGRRSYDSEDQQRITLPSVPAAASSQCQAWIGPGLSIDEKSSDVDAILFDSVTGTPDFDIGAGLSSRKVDLRDAIGLRYQASQSPTIAVSKSDRDKHVSIIRREQIRIIASSRGVDRIEATYWLAPSAKSVRVQYEPNLRLISMSRNGSAVPIGSSPTDSVTIPPREVAEIVRLTWNRDQYENLWIRKCVVPQISVSGIVLQSQCEMIPASDAFAPAALLHGFPTTGESYSTIDLQMGDSVTLVRRNIVLATGWLLAMLVFAFSWLVAKRNPLLLACMTMVVVTGLLLWWPWRLAVIGWFVVPMIAAGMLATCRAGGTDKPLNDPLSGGGQSRLGSSIESTDTSGDFSVQTVFRLLPWLLLIAGLAGTTLVAQEPRTGNAAADGEPDQLALPTERQRVSKTAEVMVLVPFKETGEQMGETVYVEKSLHEEFIQPNDRAEPVDARFQSARYQVRIGQSRDRRAQPRSQVIEAEYLIHVDNPRNQSIMVRLPLALASVRRIELLDNPIPLRNFAADGPNSIVVKLPKGDSFRIRLTLTPTTTASEQWNQMKISVPSVAASQLFIESDQEIDALRVGGPEGVLVKAPELRRWNDLLGPVNRLDIEYRLERDRRQRPIPDVLKRKYLIDAGQHSVSIDCQLDPPGKITAGDLYQFFIRDERKPVITSRHWKLERSTLLESSLRRITVVSRQDAPGSIHLHWTLPTDTKLDDTSEQYAISIPEVIATGSAETADAWIALRCDPALQFAPLVGEDIDSLSVDHFNAAWTGHRVRLDRGYVVLDALPSLVVQYVPRTKAFLNRSHHLHVTADQCQLRFEATLQPNDHRHDIYCLRFPSRLKLRELKLDGTPQAFRVVNYSDYQEVSLPDLSDLESIQIEAMGVLALDDQLQFSPPQIDAVPATVGSDEYLISRDPSVAIHATDQDILDPSVLTNEVAVDWLKQGWSPVMSLDLNATAQSAASPSGESISAVYQVFRVQPYSTSFDCLQLTSISQQAGAWMMETTIRFDSEQTSDVIDVEAPRRWCSSLEVEGALQWLRLGDPSADRQIIRIRYDKQSVAEQPLKIRGQLFGIDSDLLRVPAVQVLGPGRRQIYLDVPARSSGGNPISWQTVAVESASLPALLNESGLAGGDDRSSFVVSNPGWSIKLATLPEANVEPIASLFDGNVFSRSDGALILCRWDLFPGSRDSIDIRVPDDSSVLAAWSAGRAAPFHRIDGVSEVSVGRNQTVRVPLSVGRLPQTVEILVRVSPKAAKLGQFVPELIGIQVNRKWLVHHVPKYQSAQQEFSQAALSFSSSQGQSLSALARQRQLALAGSILDSVESIDRASGQPQQEVTALVRNWLSRYQRLLQQTQLDEAPESIQSQWQPIDLRLTQLFQRYGFDPDQPLDDRDQRSSFLDGSIDSDFAHPEISSFQVERITALNATDNPRPVQPTSATDRGLRNLIVNGLTIALVIGLMLCLIPIYRFVAPITAHPSFWLALMGVFGFAIAPIGVAAAILLLAVTLPVFPTKKQVSELAGH